MRLPPKPRKRAPRKIAKVPQMPTLTLTPRAPSLPPSRLSKSVAIPAGRPARHTLRYTSPHAPSTSPPSLNRPFPPTCRSSIRQTNPIPSLKYTKIHSMSTKCLTSFQNASRSSPSSAYGTTWEGRLSRSRQMVCSNGYSLIPKRSHCQ